MTLEETLVGVVIGSVLAYGSSIAAQNYLLKRQQSEDTKQRVYSPLYDEIMEAMGFLAQGDDLVSTKEWHRISKEEHLVYRIDDIKLQADLRKFYGFTLAKVREKVSVCTNFYPPLVVADLNQRLNGQATQTSMADVQDVAKAVGWNLQRNLVPPHQIPSASAAYERLRVLSPNFEIDNFLDYFLWWKDKTAKQRQILEYIEAKVIAVEAAESLRRQIQSRLGDRSGIQDLDNSSLNILGGIRKFKPLGQTILVVLGALLSKIFGSYPLALAPIPVIIILLVILVPILSKMNRQSAADWIAQKMAKWGPWVAETGADFSVGVGVTIFLIAYSTWGGLVVSGVFVGLALEMLWLGDIVRAMSLKSRRALQSST